ncbi:MAG: hypothetical protein Ct9H300mP28_34010 [Pseudomonadota bacterium]|nr:MAG: hypothetical protein Ct9H300mP28_34010 [Pseudomonadota bacterium]
MLKQQTYLVPTLSALTIFISTGTRDSGFYRGKNIRIREHHHQSIKMFYKVEGKWRWVQMGGPHSISWDNTKELQYMVDLGVPNLDALKFHCKCRRFDGFKGSGIIQEGFYAIF